MAGTVVGQLAEDDEAGSRYVRSNEGESSYPDLLSLRPDVAERGKELCRDKGKREARHYQFILRYHSDECSTDTQRDEKTGESTCPYLERPQVRLNFPTSSGTTTQRRQSEETRSPGTASVVSDVRFALIYFPLLNRRRLQQHDSHRSTRLPCRQGSRRAREGPRR